MGKDDLKQEMPLQAIVLADSFNSKFRPITFEQPRCLLPLANTPVLDYTLEFLAASGVRETFVFCCAHPEKIDAHLAASKWTSKSSKMDVKTIVNTDAITAGDALRDIYGRDVINGDFVLVAGDVVSNLDLRPVLEEHKARRAKDKQAIMTSVFKQVEPEHRTRSLNDDVVVGINGETSEIVFFDSETASRKIQVKLSVLTDVPDLQLRHDLLDTRIDVCAPEVLVLFADNWDYSDLRTHLVGGVLSAEILGNKLYASVVSSHYAARVQCFKTYAAVSKDVVHRWTFPVSPDSNFMNTTDYRYYRNNLYRESRVSLARTAVVGADTVIGSGTSIAEGARVAGSIIGRNCVIAAGAVITDSFVWDGVTVEAGAVVDSSIVATGAVVSAGAIVPEGCVLSYNVVVGPGHTLGPFTKLTTAPAAVTDAAESSSSFASETGASVASSPLASSPLAAAFLARADGSFVSPVVENSGAAGPGGVGREYSEEADVTLLLRRTFGGNETYDGDSDSTTSEGSVEEDYNEDELFASEALATVARGHAENVHVDNIALELNSLKFAYNRTLSDVLNAILPGILSFVDLGDAPVASAKAVFKKKSKWVLLLRKYTHGPEELVDLLVTLEHYATAHDDFRRIFHIVLQLLYEASVVDDAAIFAWANLVRDEAVPDDLALLDQAARFLDWLANDDAGSSASAGDEYSEYESDD